MSRNMTIYTGDVLARLQLAKAALYPPTNAEVAGAVEPVLHGVIVADQGVLYTYTRGDRGGLAEAIAAEAPDVPYVHPVPADYAARRAEILALVDKSGEPTTDAPAAAKPIRRRFDHDLARRLRVEGVAVAALAAYFGVVPKSMYAVLSGVRVNGLYARARFDKLAAFRLREQGVPFEGIAANVGAERKTLRAFFGRLDAGAA